MRYCNRGTCAYSLAGERTPGSAAVGRLIGSGSGRPYGGRRGQHQFGRLRAPWLLVSLERRRFRRLLARGVAHNRQVALGDGVGAARLVLVDHLVHVRPEDVLGVLINVLVVQSLPKDGRPAARAAADAHARSWSVEMMAIARHQPLTAWPPSHARKRPVKP